MENKQGFSAYEDINKLARRAFPGNDVSVIASIMGNDYIVKVDGKEIAHGPSESVYKILSHALVLLDKEIQ